MAASKPVRQCKLIKPSTGERCGSPALRGKLYCYYHAGSHREFARERILVHRLDRLGAQLDAMDAAELLNFLHQKLVPFTKTLVRFPEVGYALVYTLDRISEITSLESILRMFLQQNQEFAAQAGAMSNPCSTLPTSCPESIL